MDDKQQDTREISGALKRVNRLGNATEQLFTRLYHGLTRRSGSQTQELLAASEELRLSNRRLAGLVAQQELENERLNAILASISEGIIMQDTEGRIVLMNEAAKNLLGNQKNFWESELGTLFESYRDRLTVSSELEQLGEPSRIEVNNRVLGAQLAAIADSQGQRLGTLIILRDVTKDVLAERLKDSFITHISHELKTPMTVIKMASEVLAGQPEDQPANRRMLTMLSRNIDILDRMVLELLDISEMSTGSLEVASEPLDIEALVWEVINGLAGEIERHDIDITVMVRDLDALDLTGDDQRLRWALSHLVRNAIYYNLPGGQVMVTIRTSRQNGTEAIIISVIDNGVGISSKDLPHIFERFYRGEPRTREGKRLDPRGLGQGLFVARTIATAHGGHLGVQSEVGKGSVFTLSLPARPQPAKLPG